MSRPILSTALATALLGAALVSVPAFAGDNAAVEVHVTVPAHDASNAADASKLYRRLKTEARYVCDTAAGYDRDYDTARERACETRAVSDAVRQIHQDDLSRLDDQAQGRGIHDLSLNTSGR